MYTFTLIFLNNNGEYISLLFFTAKFVICPNTSYQEFDNKQNYLYLGSIYTHFNFSV